VLGLPATDYQLDTFYLNSSANDQKAIQEEIFGPVHLICLKNSSWATFWINKITDNLIHTRKFKMISGRDDLKVLKNEKSSDIIVMEDSGSVMWLKEQTLNSPILRGDNVYLPFSRELNFESDDTLLFKKINKEFLNNGQYSLEAFVKELGIYDKLVDPGMVDGAVLKPRIENGKPVVFDHALSAIATYNIFMSKKMYDIIIRSLS
jgi:hypothetical protein